MNTQILVSYKWVEPGGKSGPHRECSQFLEILKILN